MSGPPLPAALRRPLAVLDVETTGLHPQRDGIWEVAVLLVDDGRVSARHSWLLDPGQPLPGAIAALGGVLDAELRGQPRFVAIAAELLGLLHGRLLVGHNLRFDLAFLRRGLLAAGLRLRARQLCTLRLARQLHPELPAHGLDALCAQFAIPRFIAHRAPADAEATWQLLLQLAAHPDCAGLLDGQLRQGAVPPGLGAARLAALPERSGVYYFFGEGGALLYVGKSRNLRRRVQSHFHNDHASRRSLQMAQQVREVRVTPTAGELGALLLEAAEVARLQPLYNRQLRRQRELLSWTLQAVDGGLRPELQALARLGPGSEHAGLFRARRDALEWLRGQAREHGLCLRLLGLESGQGACFAAQLGQCRGACCAREPRGAHDARLRAALAGRRLAAWPWRGPVALVERDAVHGLCEWHVLDGWRHLGSVRDPAQIAALLASPAAPFTRDTYRILRGHLRRHPEMEIVELCMPSMSRPS